MTALITSAVSYADIAFFVILALCLIIGVIGGMARAFKGFFKSIAVILIALLLVGATLTPLCRTDGISKISDSFADKASGWGAVYTEPIYIADDGSYYIYAEYDGSTQKVKLEDAGGHELVDASKAKLAAWLAERFITKENEGTSLSQAAASMFTSIIVAVVAFIIYCIALAILFFIIRRSLKSAHSSENATVRVIDRTAGALLYAALGILFMLLVLAIFHTVGKAAPSLDTYLKQSAVCGYLYEHNPIGVIFARIFG